MNNLRTRVAAQRVECSRRVMHMREVLQKLGVAHSSELDITHMALLADIHTELRVANDIALARAEREGAG